MNKVTCSNKSSRLIGLAIVVIALMIAMLSPVGVAPAAAGPAGGMIIDHRCTNINTIPESAILQAKSQLHIAYGHTSHGSQLPDGMTGLVGFMNGLGHTTDLYAWNNGGTGGALDLHDYAMPGDLGNPDRVTWAQETRDFLGPPDAGGHGSLNPDVNVIMWSWCGQVDGSQADIDTYLNLMNGLEAEYPAVNFVYMTGHLNGTGAAGNVNVRNQQIRDYCTLNNKVLYDFADIESYDPDGAVNYMTLLGNDNCDYDSDGSGSQDRNWAIDWQNAHVQDVDWYNCSAAHSQPLNGNRKAYAAWWMFARLAGWNPSPPVTHSITVTQGAHGTIAPAGTGGVVTVDHGASRAFTITPAAGYHVADVIVDGGSRGALAHYTFANVVADHTIRASFVINSPPASPTWYLAEGTSDYGFTTNVNIENPNSTAVTAQVTYMTKSGPKTRDALTLPPLSQTVVNPADDIGATDFSTKVECVEGKTICVDRRMSWSGAGAASPEGHSSVGVTAPATTWYLPEGSSRWGFETWLLVQNPNGSDAHITLTYMKEGEGPVPITKVVPANSRASFSMETDIGQADASVKLESSVPVMPERAMYRNDRREGHDSIGTTTPASDFYLAEGTTAWGFTTYVLIQNPHDSPAEVTITYMTPSGTRTQDPFTLAANSRKTIRVNDIAGMESTDFSTRAHGNRPIIAERAMYWNNGSGEACHDSIGMSAAHTTFYLPDGQSSGGFETWTLVQNPNATSVQVEISYLTPTGGGGVTRTETIPASSRQTFGMLEHSGINGRASIRVTSKTAGKRVMVERAMYWNARGAGTDTIGGFED